MPEADPQALDYDTIERNITTWLAARPDVRAAAVIGSRGRASIYTADAGSDLDLLLIAAEPERFGGTAWLDALGPVVSAVYDPNDHVAFAHSLDFFCVFADGNDADISVLPLPYVREMIADPAARASDFVPRVKPMFTHGLRVLHDPEHLFDELAQAWQAQPLPRQTPDEARWTMFVEDFWQRSVRIAKKLRAGRYFTALQWSVAQAADVVRLAEWHARSAPEANPDVLIRDKYLERWAEPRLVAALPKLFPSYGTDGTRDALVTAMDTFGRLARETAGRLGYEYNERSENELGGWARRALSAIVEAP